MAAALALSFGLHYILDGIYHFEAFYELSVPGGWTYPRTMAVLFAVASALAVPAAVLLGWKHPRLRWFGCYAFLLTLVAFDYKGWWRIAWAALLTLAALLMARDFQLKRWILCGFAAYLPDCFKRLWRPLASLHDAFHYKAGIDLGDWVSLIVRGYWKVPLNLRAWDRCYQVGWGLSILIEAAILFGCLYWLSRRSMADLPAVDHQGRPVDKGSLVGK